MRAIGQDSEKDPAEESGAAEGTSEDFAFDPLDEVVAEPEAYEEYEVEVAATGRSWIAPTLAVAAIVAWTAFYGWAMQGAVLAAGAGDWVRLIVDWSIPVALIGVAWILAMRNSRAEASRFAHSAALLSNESQRLEDRLTVVNRELSLAREFLASQSRELESLGRIASEKLSTHADELQQLIKANGDQVEAIGTASDTALSNMKHLRDDLPVVANSARDVSNQIGNANRTAKDGLDALVSGFERLNQFGKASETQVSAVGTRVDEILAGFQAQLTQIEAALEERFGLLSDKTDSYRNSVSETEAEAMTAITERMATMHGQYEALRQKLQTSEEEAVKSQSELIERLQSELAGMVQTVDQLDKQAVAAALNRVQELHKEAGRFDDTLAKRDARFLEEMERRQAEFETRETQATEVLAQRLAELDELLAERREAQVAETEKLVEHGRAMSEELQSFNALITQIGENSAATRESLSQGLGTLEEQLASKRDALAETEAQLEKLTETSIRVLEIIQSGAKQSREDLPQAIKAAAEDLSAVEERATALNGMMFQTSQQGNQLSDYLTRTTAEISEVDGSIDALKAKLAEQADDTLAKLQGLRTRLAQLSDEGETFATASQDQLSAALDRLQEATEQSFAALDTGARESVTALAQTLSEEAVEALERSLRNETAETIGALEQAASHASGVGREATIQLRDQLAMVNELTGNLEQRVARARELAEEQVNNDFSRRMALITDSLNSNAIDITNALSTEVSDTAWGSYLKGDRGIFTRRAVRLIETGQSRQIAELYQQDESFRGNVSRYIHDFEAMLRSMLSTRDGNALSVTVLGSDMGKLYVLLAQSIERFRS